MTEAPRTIECALLPVDGDTLLLPAAALLEVVGGERLRRPPGEAPAWLLGTLTWRGEAVPVLSFAELAGGDLPAPARRLRVAILRVPDGAAPGGRIGLRCRGYPQWLPLAPRVIGAEPLAPDQRLRLARARVGALRCAVPDLDGLLAQLRAAGSSHGHAEHPQV